jgi:hypothetical protein
MVATDFLQDPEPFNWLTNTHLLASCLRAFRGRVEFEPWVLIKKLQSGFPRVYDPSTADTAIV